MKDIETTNRRLFMISVAAGASVLAGNALAQSAVPMLSETDAPAAALGYVADTLKADAKKYTKHTNEQKCLNCQMFAGKPTDASGGCPLFVGKQVAAAGWCSVYMKKEG